MNIRLFTFAISLAMVSIFIAVIRSTGTSPIASSTAEAWIDEEERGSKWEQGSSYRFSPTFRYLSEGLPRTTEQITNLNNSLNRLIDQDSFLSSVKLQRDLSYAILVDNQRILTKTLETISKKDEFFLLLSIRHSITDRERIGFNSFELQVLQRFFDGRLRSEQFNQFLRESGQIRAGMLSYIMGHYWYHRLEIPLAKRFFEDAVKRGFHADICNWYLAKTHSLTGENAEAINICNKLMRSNDPIMVEKATALHWQASHVSKAQ